MKIIIAGGSGFLGESLSQYFIDRDDEVITLSRKPNNNQTYWDGKNLGTWTQQLDGADVIINLAGKSVDCRYTERNKKQILDSRIESTVVLNQVMLQCKNPPRVFLNASTATIYIHSETHLNTEKDGVTGDDFSMGIGKAWEKEFFSTSINGVRKIALRTSIVLGNNGGAFPKMKMITKLGMGGKQGRGHQMISWIHIEDFCRAIDHLIHCPQVDGVVNITSPHPVINNLFMKQLRKILKIPIGISQPVWLLELGAAIIGTETELLLKSRNVYPQRLLESGFEFTYKNLNNAFKNLL